MRHLAVIGTPIAHSLSPAMHNAAADALGSDFSLRAIDPLDEAGFRAFCKDRGGIIGFCVTVPYKQVAFELCDELSVRAKNIGAVNTVAVRADGTLYGENTDAPGFGRALAEGLTAANLLEVKKPAVPQNPIKKAPPAHFSDLTFLVRGTGGVARAIVYELIARRAKRILILSRDMDRAAAFAESFSALATMCRLSPPVACESAESVDFDVFVNASVLGLSAEDALPLSESLLNSGRVRYVFDAVYAKGRPTRLVATAQKYGIPAQDGKMMLVYQGVIASSVWDDFHSIWTAGTGEATLSCASSCGSGPSSGCESNCSAGAGATNAAVLLNPDEKENLVTRAMTNAVCNQPLVLVGFMGAGKTSVGRALAEKTGRPFFDIDACVEEAEEQTVAEIFSLRGEDAFRDEETVALKKVLAHGDSAIIASGGGIVVREENRTLLSESAHVVYLCVPLKAALERVGSDENRPLLVDSEDAVEYLFAQRSSLYEMVADETIDASMLSVDEIAEQLCRELELSKVCNCVADSTPDNQTSEEE